MAHDPAMWRAGDRLVCTVSDAIGYRAMLAQVLEDCGWRVLELRLDRDGVAAAIASEPDLVILDALGESAVAQRFLVRLVELGERRKRPAPPVVALTDGTFHDPSGLVVAQLRSSCSDTLEHVLRAVLDDFARQREPTLH